MDISHLSSLLLITGLSGAGKSSASAALSDLGYYTIDHLPVALFSDFIALTKKKPERYSKTGILLDIDSKEKLAQFLKLLESSKPLPQKVKILFLDASNQALIRRYSETRRPHPSFEPEKDKSLEDTIVRERSRLTPLKEVSQLVMDTSERTIHDLRREIRSFAETLTDAPATKMRINFQSFGFKHGLPLDCDMVADVRFLPNPYFVEELREGTGMDVPVRDYVLKQSEAKEFLKRYADLLSYLIPHFVDEGKSYINIGIGCTGGRHRSVAIAEDLQRQLKFPEFLISVKHRDLEV